MDRYVQSINYTSGRGGKKIEIAVMHVMDAYRSGVDQMESTIQWFQNKNSFASSTYLIARDGSQVQMVNIDDTPWTNGIHYWDDQKQKVIIRQNPGFDQNGNSIANSIAVTFEHEPTIDGNFTDAQYHAVAEILRNLGISHGIRWTLDNVMGHNNVDPRSKPDCPGRYDYNRLIDLIYPQPPIIMNNDLMNDQQAQEFVFNFFKYVFGRDAHIDANDFIKWKTVAIEHGGYTTMMTLLGTPEAQDRLNRILGDQAQFNEIKARYNELQDIANKYNADEIKIKADEAELARFKSQPTTLVTPIQSVPVTTVPKVDIIESMIVFFANLFKKNGKN